MNDVKVCFLPQIVINIVEVENVLFVSWNLKCFFVNHWAVQGL